MSEIKTFIELRKKIGKIIGQSIGPHQFEQVITERDKFGSFQSGEQMKTIIAILEYLEAQDEKNPSLQSTT